MLNWMGLPLRRNSFIGLILLLILAHRVGFYFQSLQRRSARLIVMGGKMFRRGIKWELSVSKMLIWRFIFSSIESILFVYHKS